MKKKELSKVFIMICLMMVFTVGVHPINANAASATTKIKKLVKQMQTYECSVLYNSTKSRTIKLTNKEMAKAAALSINIKQSNRINMSEEYAVYKVSKSKVKKKSKNLFGKQVSTSSLPKKKMSQYDIIGAIRTQNGTPAVYFYQNETETDYVVISTSVRKKSSSYQVVKKVYFGYWGANRGKANYKIVYTVKKSKKSSYGYVIKKMKIKKI